MSLHALAVGLNPVMQKTLILEHLWENEVNRSNRYYLTVAGKGANTARVLTELGVPTTHLTHGGGIHRDLFLSLLRGDEIKLQCIDSESEIRLCYTLINEERHTVTEIVEEALPVAEKTDGLMREAYLSLLEKTDYVTISGTTAAGYSKDIVPWMTMQASKAGKRVILDVKGNELLHSVEHHPFIITPNMKEFLETLFPDAKFREHGSDEELAFAKEKMQELYCERGIISVLTRGTKSVLSCSGNEVHEFPIDPVKPVNTIGSGDAFTAGLTCGISRNMPLDAAIALAAECGRKNALNIKPGSIL